MRGYWSISAFLLSNAQSTHFILSEMSFLLECKPYWMVGDFFVLSSVPIASRRVSGT